MEQNKIYVFGAYRLDTATQLLWNADSKVTITPKVYRLLLYFLSHPRRMIFHEELFISVWDGRSVDDSALRLAVNALRNALQDESKSPDYIETACKRGYRFLAEVTVKVCYRIAEANEISPLHYQPNAQLLPASQTPPQGLAELQDAFQQVANGERRLVFLCGEHGVGKTALLEAFLATVHHPDLAVLRARCVQMGVVAEPFLPLLEALEERCREPYGKLLIECLNQLAPSWLYQLLNVLNPDEVAALLPKVADICTGRMLREGADLFEMLGNKSAFILILDNAQWSDEFSLDLVNFLMFRETPAKLLIIVSYRPCDDAAGVLRLTEMRAELLQRGLCQELAIQQHLDG